MSFSQGAEEHFPADNPWLQQGPFGAGDGWSGSSSETCALRFPPTGGPGVGSRAGAGSGAARGLAGGSRASLYAAPAIICFPKCWAEGSQKATGSHFSRSLYLVANAPFTPSASSLPSTVRLNPVLSL